MDNDRQIPQLIGRVWLVLLLGMAVWFAIHLQFEPKPEIDWSAIGSEIVMTVLSVVWIFILSRNAISRFPYVLLLTGFALIYIGMLQNTLGELYDIPRDAQVLEQIGIPMGMVVITFGLVVWIRDQHRAYHRLLEHKRALEHLSITDELTGLMNSRQFYHTLEHELERGNRYRHSLSLLFIDIDNFKSYNDSYGHLEGNNVLRACADVISSALRESDSAYRFGGEEFTVLLPETEGSDALAVAERIRTEFEARQFYPAPDTKVSRTLSIGVAEHLPDETVSQLINRADAAMYTAKVRGKNRVEFTAPAT